MQVDLRFRIQESERGRRIEGELITGTEDMMKDLNVSTMWAASKTFSISGQFPSTFFTPIKSAQRTFR